MNKRPDCFYCQIPESAMVFLGGRVCCGSCYIKWDKKQKEEVRKMMVGI